MEFSTDIAPYAWYMLQAYALIISIIIIGLIVKTKKKNNRNQKSNHELELVMNNYPEMNTNQDKDDQDDQDDQDNHKPSEFPLVRKLTGILVGLQIQKLKLEENNIKSSQLADGLKKEKDTANENADQLLKKIIQIFSKYDPERAKNANAGNAPALIGVAFGNVNLKYDDLKKEFETKTGEYNKLRVEQYKFNSMIDVLAETLVSDDDMEYLEGLSSAIINRANIDNPEQVVLAKGALLEAFKREIQKRKALKQNGNKGQKQSTTDISAA